MKFEKADVLLSTNYRYFGKEGTADYKKEYRAVKAAIERLGRSYRVNHEENLRSQLMELKKKMWQNPDKIQGKPTSLDQRKLCNRNRILKVCLED